MKNSHKEFSGTRETLWVGGGCERRERERDRYGIGEQSIKIIMREGMVHIRSEMDVPALMIDLIKAIEFVVWVLVTSELVTRLP